MFGNRSRDLSTPWEPSIRFGTLMPQLWAVSSFPIADKQLIRCCKARLQRQDVNRTAASSDRSSRPAGSRLYFAPSL
jgi:hypothetical protein